VDESSYGTDCTSFAKTFDLRWRDCVGGVARQCLMQKISICELFLELTAFAAVDGA
jgi:hypothetical protein